MTTDNRPQPEEAADRYGDNREETLPGWTKPRHFERPRNRMLKVRNCLNLIFMLTAIAGMALYWLKDSDVGTIVICVAIVIKFTESALRLFPQK